MACLGLPPLLERLVFLRNFSAVVSRSPCCPWNILNTTTNAETRVMTGSLVPSTSKCSREHPALLMLQTCMSDQSKSKNLHRVSTPKGSRRARRTIHVKRLASRLQSGGTNRRLAPPRPSLHPARGLLICFAWLRLFHAIVSDGVSAPGKHFAHET